MSSSTLLWLSYAVLSFLVYLAVLAIHRLYFHPLARFPGPKLAALTSWYEFYYDVILDGQFYFKRKELHELYGEFNFLLTPHHTVAKPVLLSCYIPPPTPERHGSQHSYTEPTS